MGMEKPIRNGLWDLPGFEETRAYLKGMDKPCGWVDEIVERDSPGASFVKLGKPWYKSECPHYEGFWLNGGLGSVQCQLVPYLVPGLHYQLTCGVCPDQCPFRKEKEG